MMRETKIVIMGFVFLLVFFIRMGIKVPDKAKEVKGLWESVDLVRQKSVFNPEKRWWKGSLYFKKLEVYRNGDTNWAFRFVDGRFYHPTMNRWHDHEIKEIDGQTYMFFEWIDGINGTSSYYVLRKKEFDDSDLSVASGKLSKSSLYLHVIPGWLIILGSLPLMLGKVRRNRWYGLRTRMTMSDPMIWRETNKFFGKYLFLWGIFQVFGGHLFNGSGTIIIFTLIPMLIISITVYIYLETL